MSLEPLTKGVGEAELAWAVNSRGDFEVGPCPQGGSREAEKISPMHRLWEKNPGNPS